MTILKTITYFSLFNHPLTKEEIFRFCKYTNKEEFIERLEELEYKQIIYNVKDHYFFEPNGKTLQKRINGNKAAEEIMPKAWEVGKFISKFPYVRGVCISGSLSKGYFDKDSDIDFFIISEKNRLWITRTFLVLYKKMFLLNSKEFFCVNYFMSSGYLKVDEENRFTATEVATLAPLYGKEIYTAFTKRNEWVYSFFPNLEKDIGNNAKEIRKSTLSKLIEWGLNSRIGDFFERFFMKKTIKRWNKMFNHLSDEEFKIAFKSSENMSKHHPQNFQTKVLHRLNERYSEIEKTYGIKLDKEYA
ncbi:nucleotidyltransferase domain-containing protein [Aquimarina sp. 2201CG1-2-11]|uniref:nucleotidyltransferase domain-containing protein n=1 Tax=Aquimarina discodermiae TaxID=3231043 RepID=UPI00346272AE